ncbi:MAG: CHAT domain-containing protein [Vicinamibacteria bacterium]
MQWRRHEIALEAGQFLQATLYQRGLDAVLRLVAPDGRVIEAGVDSSEGISGPEPASMLATLAGRYAIEVWAPADMTNGGSYELETQAPRAPDDRDRARLRAESLMAAGGRVMGPRATGGRRLRMDGPRGTQAAEAYGAALPLWAGLGESCWQAEAATCLGNVQYWQQKNDESRENLVAAADLWQSCGDEHKFLESVLFVGRWFVANARFREAAETYDFGLRHAEEGRDDVLRLQFLVQLTLTYGHLGDTERALSVGEEALAELRARGYAQGTAMTLSHLAAAHLRRGELERASERLLEALPVHWDQAEVGGGLSTLLSLGEVFEAMGEPDIALGYYQDVVARAPGTRAFQLAPARAGMAAILARTGQLERAYAEMELSITDSRYASSQDSETAVHLQFARLLLENGALARAREHVHAAQAILAASGDRVAVADAQELSGLLDLAAGRRDDARAAFAEGLALRRFVGDRVGEARALQLQARLARTGGDLDEARSLLEEARSIVSAQRGLLATPQLRATWSSTVRGIDESYVGVLTDLHRVRPSEGFDARAFEASESASARSLLEVLADRGELPHAAVSGLAARERSVRERLTSALDRQVRARATGQARSTLDPLAQEVRDLSAEHRRIQSALGAGGPRDATTVRPEPLRLAQVQEVLEDDSTLLEFWLGEERGYAWVVGRGRLHSYELPARARVEAAVEAARIAVSAPPTAAGSRRAARALRALADLVLPADRGWLRGRRLVVVADGALHRAPFAALPDVSGEPLVARFEIANVPSASVAAALRRLQAERAPAPRAVAVIADPVYDTADARLGGSGPVQVAEPALARATRAFGFKDGRLPRLPFTRREALAIASLAPGTSTASLDFRANLDTALSPDLSSYRYVHFAAHGLLNDARPELSGLVLSLVDREGRSRPGLLTAPDVSSLHLNADLVVLSSCRSAAGREVGGEGLVGLTRAFMHAGAPRVVASLWPVDDLASAELMTAMYREMLGPAKLAPAAALRRAQTALLRHRKWKAPYYWAGFQLQGEWR